MEILAFFTVVICFVLSGTNLSVLRTGPDGKKNFETQGMPLADGTGDTDNQKKAVGSAIDLLESLAAAGCLPSGDPAASPPTPPFGGAPGATPSEGISTLDALSMANKIGYDKDLPKRPGVGEGTTAATYPGGDGVEPIEGGGTLTSCGTDGMNISKLPLNTTNPAAASNPAFSEHPAGSGCYFSSNQMLDLMLDLGHENTHLQDPRDDLRGLPEAAQEGPVITSENMFLCSLADCLASGSAGAEATAFFDPIDKATEKACKKILENNKRLKSLTPPQAQVMCSSCPNDGLCPTGSGNLIGDPASDGHPSNQGASVGAPGPGVFCGWNTTRRIGYNHTGSEAAVGLNDLNVSIDQSTNLVEVNLSGLDYSAGFVSYTIDCNTVSVSAQDGVFFPVSVAAISAHSIVLGGYSGGSGKGAFIKYSFKMASVGPVGGGPATQQLLVSQDVMYSGCGFTYPVCLAHNENDSFAYFFDRDRQAIGAISLISSVVFEMANSVDHPELEKTLFLAVGRYRDESGVHGVRLSTSLAATSRVVMISDPNKPIFNLADTDRDLRLDYFWNQN